MEKLSRRQILGGFAAITASLPLSAAARQIETATPESDASPTAGWSFTDDRGVTISLPEPPKRIVAQTTAAAALWDLGVQVVGVIGPNRLADGTNDFQAGNIDFNTVATLGDYGADSLELDVEKLVELQPDLIIDMTYGGAFWYVESEREVLEQIAPMAGFSMEKVSILTSIEHIENFAQSLDADLNAPAVAADKANFADAENALRTAISEKPGLSVLSISPSVQNVYVCSPRWMTDLHYFQDLGLAVVDHDADEFFQIISWEEINRYPADLILVDVRGTQTGENAFTEVATWKTLPAVQANQIGPWYAGAPYSRARLTPIMTELTDIIRNCQTDIV